MVNWFRSLQAVCRLAKRPFSQCACSRGTSRIHFTRAGGVAPWHLWAQELRSINRDRMLEQDMLDWPDDDDEETEH